MIVITTMDALPYCCYECPCNNGEYSRCEADKERRSTSEYRPYWCPLKEVTINYLNEEKEKIIRDIDLYIADMKEDKGATYFRGTIYGLTIAKEILQGIRNHG